MKRNLKLRVTLFSLAVIAALTLCPVARSQPSQNFPKGSIGDRVGSLDDILKKPDSSSRYIIFVSPPIGLIKNGVFVGYMPTDIIYETYEVEMLEDGASFKLKVFQCGQTNGQNNNDCQIKSAFIFDPSNFEGAIIVPPSSEEPENSKSYVVTVKTKTTKPEPSIFAIGFIRKADAEDAKEIIDNIIKRAKFEAKVEKLPTLPTFGKRSELYNKIHEELQEQGTKIGFFGAASAVTFSLSWDILPDITQGAKESATFLNSLSVELSKINYLTFHGKSERLSRN